MENGLKIYDSRLKAKVSFEPINKDCVGFYGCGPTVYDRIHIGNARTFVVYDLINRVLRHLYGAHKVNFVRNITDVDDKINARAAERGISIEDLTQQTTSLFHQDLAALNILEPTFEPRATDHIENMIEMISGLINKSHAYISDDEVLFNVKSFPEYGDLSGRSLDQLKAGARVEVANTKDSPLDFILWKPSSKNEPGWDSPWGFGRPGWHIECSAMAAKYLDKQFDIHAGGIDLVFPHHENEIAQTRCCYGVSSMANYWMHVGFVQFDEQKMSKSLGNVITVAEALKKTSGAAIRLALITSHYRQPLFWNDDRLSLAEKTLNKWKKALDGYVVMNEEDARPPAEFIKFLADDLATPKAMALLHQYAAQAEKGDDIAKHSLYEAGKILGVFSEKNGFIFDKSQENKPKNLEIDDKQIEALINARNQARIDKDYGKADIIRKQLDESGIEIFDSKSGTSWGYKD